MKIKSVTRITLHTPVPVYDITVSETENFTLAAGPVAHNSKDVADAVCGVAAYLLTRRKAWTSQPIYQGRSGLMLHGYRTGVGSIKLDQISDAELAATNPNGRKSIKERRSISRMTPRRRNID